MRRLDIEEMKAVKGGVDGGEECPRGTSCISGLCLYEYEENEFLVVALCDEY